MMVPKNNLCKRIQQAQKQTNTEYVAKQSHATEHPNAGCGISLWRNLKKAAA